MMPRGISEIEKQHHISNENQQLTGKDIKIAVVEAAFNLKHPAFTNLGPKEKWFDGFKNRNGVEAITYSTKKSHFFIENSNSLHGNHVLGLVGGIHHLTGEKLGLATGAILIPICAMNSSAIKRDPKKISAYIRAFEYLKTIDVQIINLSQKLLITPQIEHILLELVQQGKIIVYAAGNNNLNLNKNYIGNFLQHPLLKKGLIIVGNCDAHDKKSYGEKKIGAARFNEASNYIDGGFNGNFIWANGVDRYSASHHDYLDDSGTSMAAPTVAGALALLWEQNPQFTNEEIIKIVLGSARISEQNNYPVLDVANMLTPEKQQEILSRPTKKLVLEANASQHFDHFTIELNDFPIAKMEKFGGHFIFKKLSADEILSFNNEDYNQLKNHYSSLVEQAEQIYYFGLLQEISGNRMIIMPMLAVEINHDLYLLTNKLYWEFDNTHTIMNELFYYLAQQTSFKLYNHLYTTAENIHFENIDLDQSQKFHKKIKDLYQPHADYFSILHSKIKTEDFLPNITIELKDIAAGIDSNFIKIEKADYASLHKKLLENPNDFNQLYVTSAYYHLYHVYFKNDVINLNAYITQENNILIFCDSPLNNTWFEISRILQKFNEEAKKQGIKVYYARPNYTFSLRELPFKLNQNINNTPLEPSSANNNTRNFLNYELDRIYPFEKAGNGEYGFIDARKKKSTATINYFLKDLRCLDEILKFAILETDLDLVKLVCETHKESLLTDKKDSWNHAISLAENIENKEIQNYLKDLDNPSHTPKLKF